MNVVDSSGWVEYLTDGKNAEFFASPICDTENLAIPTVCLYEVFKRILLEFGEETALDAMGPMWSGHITELSSQLALEAARISTELKLAMANSIIFATAQA